MAESGEAARRIRRLERRLERERSARVEAETIADRGMRQLWEANRELDRRVNQRTAELSKALEDLQVATSARDQLLTNMSHEVRTPLNGIVGTLELIGPHVDDPDGKRYLAAARSSANDLNVLVSQLLLAVEAASGRLVLKPEPVPLSSLVNDTKEVWELKGMKLGYLVIVVCPSRQAGDGDSDRSPIILVVDPARVRQVIDGLVGSIIEFSSPGAVQVEFNLQDEDLVIGVSVPVANLEPSLLEAAPSLLVGRGNGYGVTSHLIEALGGRLTAGLNATDQSWYSFTARIQAGAQRVAAETTKIGAEPIGQMP